MQVTTLENAVRRPRRVAVGEFDGVHLGHRQVILGNDTVLTFEPHPATVVRPERAPKLLTSLEVKIELISELDVEELVIVPFDVEFAQRSGQDFIDSILVDRLSATHVSVGENFRFGHRATGDTRLLEADGRFATRVVPLVQDSGEAISSTRIRAMIANGEVARAAELLGAGFRMRSEVVFGDRRGRELGFPTANLIPDPQLACPADGVYACYADGTPAAVNVGVRPTFNSDRGLLVEAFLLDFEGDLYGEALTIEFVERLRAEERFESIEHLVAQMQKDVERTRELLASGVE